MIRPHGGKLTERILADDRKCELLESAPGLPHLKIEADKIDDLGNIATGAFSPLEGFMGRADFASVLNRMRLSNGPAWPIPIVLDATKEDAAKLKIGDDIILATGAGEAEAVLHLAEKFDYDKEEMARKVFQTTDAAHPGVAKVRAMKDILLGGKIDLLRDLPTSFARYALSPIETRSLFREKGRRTIAGCLLRNVPGKGDESALKAALTFTDGLFIHLVLEEKETGGPGDEVILASFEKLIKDFDRPERVVLAVMRMDLRFAGPREAIFSAILQKNFGCSHILISRERAGVGDYYHPYAAQDIFEEFPDLGIIPLFFGPGLKGQSWTANS